MNRLTTLAALLLIAAACTKTTENQPTINGTWQVEYELHTYAPGVEQMVNTQATVTFNDGLGIYIEESFHYTHSDNDLFIVRGDLFEWWVIESLTSEEVIMILDIPGSKVVERKMVRL